MFQQSDSIIQRPLRKHGILHCAAYIISRVSVVIDTRTGVSRRQTLYE